MSRHSFSVNSLMVFDLGMNDGDDTAFYLSRGLAVVAVEANPVFCEKAHARFSAAIDDKRLIIINAAVSQNRGEATFHINLDNDHWSSLNLAWATRNASRCQAITVQCVTLLELFDRFGAPHYLKIDVEGADQMVLEQLQDADCLPLYVSVEDCRFGLQYLEILASCGYDRFNLLDQSTVPQMTDAMTGHVFSPGSSGPFGKELPGKWLRYEEMVAHYTTTVRDRDGNRLAPRTRWWDIHCTNSEAASV